MGASWLATGVGNGMLMHYGAALKEDLMQQEQQLALERAQRLEEMKRDFAAKDRATQAQEINAGAEGMINEKIGRRYAGSDAAVADAEAGRTDAPLTQEQKDAIAQSKAGARDEVSDVDKLRARIASGEKSGYDMSKDRAMLVSLLNHEDVANLRRETEQNKKDYYQESLRIREKAIDARGTGSAGRGSGGKDDHWDDKQEDAHLKRSDKWLTSNYTIKDQDSGKNVPDSVLIDKASLARDDLAPRVGYAMAHQIVQRVISDVGRDKARGMSSDELVALGAALVKKRTQPKGEGSSESPSNDGDVKDGSGEGSREARGTVAKVSSPADIDTSGIPFGSGPKFKRIAKEISAGTANAGDIAWFKQMQEQADQWKKDFQ